MGSRTGDTNKTNWQIAGANNEAAAQRQDTINATNLQLAREQNAWNIEQWHRQNRYNSPANQFQLFKEAGLSSAAAAQAVTGIPATELQSADLANQENNVNFQSGHGIPYEPAADLLQSAQNFIGLGRQLAEMRLVNAEADIKEQDANLETPRLYSGIQGQEWYNKQMMISYEQQVQEMPYHVQSRKYDSEIKKYGVYAAEYAANNEKMNYDLVCQKFAFLEKYNEGEIRRQTEEVNNLVKAREHMQAEIKELISRKNMNEAQAKAAIEQSEYYKKYGDLLDEQRFGQQITNSYNKFGAPESVAQRISAQIVSGNLTPLEVGQQFNQTQNYMHVGYETFKNDPLLFNFFDMILDEGSGEMLKSGYHTPAGTMAVPQLLGTRKFK